MSNIPRTDAILPLGSASDFNIPHVAIELAGLSRQLERELQQALSERDKAREKLSEIIKRGHEDHCRYSGMECNCAVSIAQSGLEDI